MLRTGASRLAMRSTAAPAARPSASFVRRTASPVQWTTEFSSATAKRPQLAALTRSKPMQAAVLRRSMADNIDREREAKYQRQSIKPTPETITATSSIPTMTGGSTGQKDVDMMAGVKHDLETIKDTFTLRNVPQQAYYVGLAGVLPYLATSLSTVACAFEINHAVAGYGYLMSSKTAEALLQVLEPLQIGYGAVIISFLGAIHWGLEWAGYGGYQGYNRYAIGVLATAAAWPTVLLPVEYALISQFAAFTLLYYVDTRATYRGWTPPWYAMYRFVLTFIVGASIVISLIGRGEVADRVGRLPGAVDRIKTLREDAEQHLAEEEEGIMAQQAAEEAKDKGDATGKKSSP